jgi:hypothetical protein
VSRVLRWAGSASTAKVADVQAVRIADLDRRRSHPNWVGVNFWLGASCVAMCVSRRLVEGNPVGSLGPAHRFTEYEVGGPEASGVAANRPAETA